MGATHERAKEECGTYRENKKAGSSRSRSSVLVRTARNSRPLLEAQPAQTESRRLSVAAKTQWKGSHGDSDLDALKRKHVQRGFISRKTGTLAYLGTALHRRHAALCAPPRGLR